MNIKMTPKEEVGEDGKPVAEKITKLAIGKPGGIDADTDRYDTNVTVLCMTCEKELPLSNTEVSGMVNTVLLTNSALESGAIEEWELEITSCPHTANIDQTNAVKIDVSKGAQCQNCDLKSNLWVNLHDGFVGCGRRYFDGSGGNHHAVEHFEQT